MSAEERQLAWRVHPAAERRGLAVLVASLILLLAVLAAAWMGSAYWGIFAGVVLFLSLEAFFLPASYELDGEGVRVRKPFSRVERPYDAFRRAVFDPTGVTLSPFRRRNWLESYRAIRLRFSRAHARADGDPEPGEVWEFLRARLDPEQVRLVEIGPGGKAIELSPEAESDDAAGAREAEEVDSAARQA